MNKTNKYHTAGRIIANAQVADRKRSIPYRPEYNLITGSVRASILIQQLLYWWQKSDRKPFYKYREPCDADKYKPGDSWTEELGFTGYQFDSALKAIGTKITRGISKNEALSCSLVVYWTDSNRQTWYELNESLLFTLIGMAYEDPETLANLKIHDYIGNLKILELLCISENQNYMLHETTIDYTENNNTSEDASIKNPPNTKEPKDTRTQQADFLGEIPDMATVEARAPEDMLLFEIINNDRRSKGRRAQRLRFRNLPQKEKWRQAARDVMRVDGEAPTKQQLDGLRDLIHQGMSNLGLSDLSGLINYVAKVAQPEKKVTEVVF